MQALAVNKRIQSQNNAPREFPLFVREGYSVKVLADEYVMDKAGLIYKVRACLMCCSVGKAASCETEQACLVQDYDVGTGPAPQDGQEVQFHYTAYNESGGRIDSSFKQGKPSVVRLGINGLIPGAQLVQCGSSAWQCADVKRACAGFEAGLKSMRVGGRRRLLVPPDLGPPVGPSTFFSAKQCEVGLLLGHCTGSVSLYVTACAVRRCLTWSCWRPRHATGSSLGSPPRWCVTRMLSETVQLVDKGQGQRQGQGQRPGTLCCVLACLCTLPSSLAVLHECIVPLARPVLQTPSHEQPGRPPGRSRCTHLAPSASQRSWRADVRLPSAATFTQTRQPPMT